MYINEMHANGSYHGRQEAARASPQTANTNLANGQMHECTLHAHACGTTARGEEEAHGWA